MTLERGAQNANVITGGNEVIFIYGEARNSAEYNTQHSSSIELAVYETSV